MCVYVHVRGKIFVLSHTWSVGATERFAREVQEPPGHALPKEHRSQGSLVQLPPSTGEEAEAPLQPVGRSAGIIPSTLCSSPYTPTIRYRF